VATLTLRPEPHDRILDLGAGAGWCSDLLGRLNRTTVALDISLELLRAGKSRPGSGLRAVAGDMEALPFAPGVFTKAICLSAIHHVPDIPKAVKEIARVLAPGGMVLFSEPGTGHANADVSTKAMRDYGVLEQDILVEDFMQACAEAGFGNVRVQPLAYVIPGYSLSLDDWRTWTRLARATRPRRAVEKIALGIAEVFGRGKGGALYEDTFGITLVRTLRLVMERNPIIVAVK
jgi:SAM-dependent methyltransferase